MKLTNYKFLTLTDSNPFLTLRRDSCETIDSEWDADLCSPREEDIRAMVNHLLYLTLYIQNNSL